MIRKCWLIWAVAAASAINVPGQIHKRGAEKHDGLDHVIFDQFKRASPMEKRPAPLKLSDMPEDFELADVDAAGDYDLSLTKIEYPELESEALNDNVNLTLDLGRDLEKRKTGFVEDEKDGIFAKRDAKGKARIDALDYPRHHLIFRRGGKEDKQIEIEKRGAYKRPINIKYLNNLLRGEIHEKSKTKRYAIQKMSKTGRCQRPYCVEIFGRPRYTSTIHEVIFGRPVKKVQMKSMQYLPNDHLDNVKRSENIEKRNKSIEKRNEAIEKRNESIEKRSETIEKRSLHYQDNSQPSGRHMSTFPKLKKRAPVSPLFSGYGYRYAKENGNSDRSQRSVRFIELLATPRYIVELMLQRRHNSSIRLM